MQVTSQVHTAPYLGGVADGILHNGQRHEVHPSHDLEREVHMGHLHQADRRTADAGDGVDERLERDAGVPLCREQRQKKRGQQIRRAGCMTSRDGSVGQSQQMSSAGHAQQMAGCTAGPAGAVLAAVRARRHNSQGNALF